MSNMNQDAFAQGAMQELSFNEIEEVSGGVPIVLAYYSIAIAGTALAAGAAYVAGATTGYAANRDDTSESE